VDELRTAVLDTAFTSTLPLSAPDRHRGPVSAALFAVPIADRAQHASLGNSSLAARIVERMRQNLSRRSDVTAIGAGRVALHPSTRAQTMRPR
jgi:hypothetical protein